MKCNWIEKKLGDLIESVSIKHKFDKKEIILINTSDVLEGKVLNHTHVENSDLRGQFKKSFMKGDILYSEIRPQNKRFAFVDFDSEDYVASTKLMVLRRKTDEITEQFLFQILKSNNLIRELQAIAESRSGTFPQITFSELSNITILLPPREEQERIVNTLSSLDKKYELNKEIIETLEETASTLFKHWFVDFEFPDEDRNPYKSSGGKMVESELGELPEGWKIVNLEAYVEIKYGKDHKKLAEGEYPVYGSGGIMRYVDKFLYSGESVLVPRKGTLSNVMYVDESFWSVDTMFYTIMKKNNIAKFIYLFLNGIDLKSMNVGSAVPSMTTNILNNMKIIKPPSQILEQFNSLISPMFQVIKHNKEENDTLKELRDTLLPKLLSGEIELPTEAEV